MSQTPSPSISRDEALDLHRSGDLAGARQAYEALAEADPGDADVLGLLGALALQEGRVPDAVAGLRAAMAAGGDPRIALRNLNNLLVALRVAGDRQGSEQALAGGLPEWPEGAEPDEVERNTILSLCEATLVLGRPQLGWRLYSSAMSDNFGDAEANGVAGRLLLALGRPEAALMPLEAAVAGAPRNMNALLALAGARLETGRDDAAATTLKQIYRRGRVLSAPAIPSQQASILVLNPFQPSLDRLRFGIRALHDGGNYPARIAATMGEDYRFHSLLVDLPDTALPEGLPRADLVVNNLADAEALRVEDSAEALSAVLGKIGLPVINPPEQVVQTTRQNNPALLEGVANLELPQIRRYRADLAPPEAIAADIAERFEFPVILRPPFAQGGSMVLVRNADEVAARARAGAWQEFYAIQHVDLARPDGWFRKLRAVFMDGEIILGRAEIGPGWMVGGPRGRPGAVEFYRANPRALEECNAILSDPGQHLGSAVMETLAAVRERIPLDMFAMDFDVDGEGRVVFFGATAATGFCETPEMLPEELRPPEEPARRIDAAFQAMVARRIAEAAARSHSTLQ